MIYLISRFFLPGLFLNFLVHYARPNEDTYRCGACFRITCQVCFISNGGQLKSCTCTNATLQSDPIVKLFISAFNYYPCKYHYNGCKTEPLIESLGRYLKNVFSISFSCLRPEITILGEVFFQKKKKKKKTRQIKAIDEKVLERSEI